MPNRYWRKIAYYGLVAIVALGTAAGIYFGFVYSPDRGAAPPVESAAKTARKNNDAGPVSSVKLKKPEIKHFIGDKVQWELKAGAVESDPKSGKSVFRDSMGQVFGEKDRIISFSAPLSEFDPAREEVRVRGRFFGQVGPDGLKLEGRDLQWSDAGEQLLAKDFSFELDGAGVRGDTLRIQPGDKTIAFEGNVVIRVPLKRK